MRLSEDAHTGLDALASRAHCTRTALLEALGLVGRHGNPTDWDEVVKLARTIDRERLNRR